MTESVEIVFSFDTTGSMAPCIGEVRRNVEAALTPLFKEIPNLKIGIIAHGDYCDETRYYVTKSVDLTNDLHKLTQFVRNTGPTGGGDAPECYELVLHEVRSFNWSLNSKKILVMIGDATPHEVTYPLNKLRLDWRKEVDELKKIGVQVYSVQALSRRESTGFYAALAQLSGGFHLKLDQFSEVVDLLMGITYKQSANVEVFDAWEARILASKRMSRSLDASIRTMTGRDVGAHATASRYDSSSTGLTPVPLGRFQILRVDSDQDIRSFVEDHGIPFKQGRGFYQFTKTETIQENKEVVLRDKWTGDMFTGDEARNLIGVPRGTRDRLRPAALEKFDIYVQSTSVNRKLKGGTGFLYEVDMDR